jgi:hypothetical protein
LLAAALGLIGLAGCFLIGVMILLRPEFVDPSLHAALTTAPEFVLLAMLYVLAGGCFTGALYLLILGVRALSRVVQQHSTSS